MPMALRRAAVLEAIEHAAERRLEAVIEHHARARGQRRRDAGGARMAAAPAPRAKRGVEAQIANAHRLLHVGELKVSHTGEAAAQHGWVTPAEVAAIRRVAAVIGRKEPRMLMSLEALHGQRQALHVAQTNEAARGQHH